MVTNTKARAMTFVVLDFETTGAVCGFPIEPWQIGLVNVDQGRVQPESQFESLIHVGDRPFNPHAPGRHALLREQLAAAPHPHELLHAVLPRLQGRALVAHNIGTERSLLTRMAPLHHLGPWVDTLDLARYAYPDLTSKSLEDVTCALGLTERIVRLCNRQPHDALFDAFACAVLFEFFLSLPGWENVTLTNLVKANCKL